LKIPHTDEFVFGTGDFTVECWVSRSSSATGAILSQYEVRGWIMQVDSTNVIKWRDQYDGTSNMTGTTTISTDGTWYHVAVTRESGTFRMFVDGELEVTNVASYNYDTTYMTEDFLVGRYSNGNSSGLNGNVDDIRISNTARYTADFTPPTERLESDANTKLLLNGDQVTIAEGKFSDGMVFDGE